MSSDQKRVLYAWGILTYVITSQITDIIWNFFPSISAVIAVRQIEIHNSKNFFPTWNPETNVSGFSFDVKLK